VCLASVLLRKTVRWGPLTAVIKRDITNLSDFLDYMAQKNSSTGEIELRGWINSDFTRWTKWLTSQFMKRKLNKSMSDQEIVLACAKWICNNTYYDYNVNLALPDSDIYFYLLNKRKGVCMHYAETLHFLLSMTGVENIEVTARKANHAWNQVTIDGKWYNVDVTQMNINKHSNKETPCIQYGYFLVSDCYLSWQYDSWLHPTPDFYTGYHKCTSTRYDPDEKSSHTCNKGIWTDGTWINY